MQWDPQRYERFRSERERPFDDLLAALPRRDYRSIIDAGCGTGRTTRRLAERWPEASVVGVDASPTMLGEACGPIVFIQADLLMWRPAVPAGLVVSNAVLHWIPDPTRVLEHLASWLADDGVLAIQVPANHDAASHRLVKEVAALPQFRDRLGDVAWGDHVLPLDDYRDILTALGLDVEAWDTTYEHVLPDSDAVVDWLAGTTLRPVFAALDDTGSRLFLDTLRPRIHQAYPPTPQGTVFPFRRRFLVAHANGE